MNDPDWDPTAPRHPWSRAVFIPGLELSRRYYQEAVGPLLARHFPGLPYSAALIGFGSDVIGLDDARSRDHMWGPRLLLFLRPADLPILADQVEEVLRAGLPHEFLGYPTSFDPPDPSDGGVRSLTDLEARKVDPLIPVTSLEVFFRTELDWDSQRPLENADWLTFSEHRLLTLTTGGVWHDDLGLGEIRARLAYYPDEVWKYLLASQWSQIGQEEPFVGRAAEAGDDLGSRLLAAKLARGLMRLAFLMERRYAPYSKWFGSAFSRLPIARDLLPELEAALAAPDFTTRESHLCAAGSLCVRRFNALGLIPPLSEQPGWFHGRPYRVLHAGEIASRLADEIQDPQLRALPALVGSVNQFSDSTDLLESVPLLAALHGWYAAPKKQAGR